MCDAMEVICKSCLLTCFFNLINFYYMYNVVKSACNLMPLDEGCNLYLDDKQIHIHVHF